MLVLEKLSLDIQCFYNYLKIDEKTSNVDVLLQLHTFMSHGQPMKKLKQSQTGIVLKGTHVL